MNAQYGIIFSVALVTFLLRATPFLLGQKLNMSKNLFYLEMYLPASIMLILVIYSVKDSGFDKYPYGIFEIISICLVAILHIKYRNALLSIIGGTLFYILVHNL